MSRERWKLTMQEMIYFFCHSYDIIVVIVTQLRDYPIGLSPYFYCIPCS